MSNVPLEKAREIGIKLLDKAESLVYSPHLGQYEEYLAHLGKDTEGWWKAISRSFIGSNQIKYISRIFLIQDKIQENERINALVELCVQIFKKNQKTKAPISRCLLLL
jgi:hypothetical protein